MSSKEWNWFDIEGMATPMMVRSWWWFVRRVVFLGDQGFFFLGLTSAVRKTARQTDRTLGMAILRPGYSGTDGSLLLVLCESSSSLVSGREVFFSPAVSLLLVVLCETSSSLCSVLVFFPVLGSWCGFEKCILDDDRILVGGDNLRDQICCYRRRGLEPSYI